MADQRQTAIVTGAARGIGYGIARKLAAAGINIVVSDIMLEEARKAALELEALGVKTLAVKTDVSSRDDAQNLIKTTIESMGGLDFLVNNAGVTRDNLSIRMSEQEWDTVIDINLKGTFLCSHFAGIEMMKKRFGRIVNIASISGILGTAGQANYAASKAGVMALTRSMARELGGRNITVNAVAPGFIKTEMTDQLPDRVKEAYMSQIPLKRPGTIEDVAEAVYFLLSPSASYITGTVLNISGGLVI